MIFHALSFEFRIQRPRLISQTSAIMLICVHVHIHAAVENVGTKTISITDEAYLALKREKINKESFTDTILRITKKSGKLADCFGTWEMSDEQQEEIESELSKGWRVVQERISNEMSGH